MSTGYAWPSSPDSWVSCSWSCHKNRNPPSGEPGTDIAWNYGTAVYAPEDGTVVEIKTSNSGAMGRYVAIDFSGDGRDTRVLHLSRVNVSVGQKVSRGQKIAEMGGSGYGDDHYYGTHAHQTLWPGQMWAAATIDFEKYTGEDEDMAITEAEFEKIARYVWAYVSEHTAGGYNMGYLARDVWNELTSAVVVDGDTIRADGKVYSAIKAIGVDVDKVLTFLPVTFTEAQIKTIADAVAAQVQIPPISDEDIAAIAKAVNDDAAARLES